MKRKRFIITSSLILVILLATIVYLTTKPEAHEPADSPYDFSKVNIISIWNKEGFDGTVVHDLVIDETLISKYHLMTTTIDNEQTAEFLTRVTYNAEPPTWQNGRTGLLIDNEITLQKISISNDGGLFSIDGIPGYFELSADLHDKWDSAVSDFSYTPNTDEFNDYNDLFQSKYLPQQMGHLLFAFDGEYDYYIICNHNDHTCAVTNPEIDRLIQLKYDTGVKLLKYSYSDDYLKLLYEDGTYFEWDPHMYCIKYLGKIKD